MKRTTVLCIGLAAVLCSIDATYAQQEEVACFDYMCWEISSDPLVTACRFDVGCSLPDAGFVSYRWDWGDGTVSFNETNQVVYHEYYQRYVTPKLTILQFGVSGESVSCDIWAGIPPYGPPTPSSGTCTSVCSLPAGHKHFCRDCGPCVTGEGDCDSAGECRTGLTCRANVGAQYGFDPLVDVCE